MIKLLCVIHDFRGRGAERVLSVLLENFDRRKFEIVVLVYNDNQAISIPKDIEILSGHIDTCENGKHILFRKIVSSVRKVLVTGKILKKYRPDLVFSVAGSNFWVIIAKYIFYWRARVILSEHIFPSIFISHNTKGIVRLGFEWLISLLYPLAELIIVPSKAVFKDLVGKYGISSRKIRIIGNPVDIQKIQVHSKDGVPLFISNDSYKVGFIGSLSWEKNIPCLLKAISILRQKGIAVELFILGEGPERESLQQLSRSMGMAPYVHFMGFLQQPYSIMSQFDVVVLPSFYECFPCSVFEAMACGVPVISTKWLGAYDIFTDMETSILIPIDDEESLSKALERILTDEKLKSHLVQNGLTLVQEYDARKITSEYEQSFLSILNS